MKIILYGAGRIGHGIYNFLKAYGLSEYIYGFCDKRAREIGRIEDQKVWLPEELEEEDLIYCLTVSDNRSKEEIKANLEMNQQSVQWIDFSDLADIFHLDKVRFNRDFCAFYHLDDMEAYYQQAESENSTDVFWNPDSVFYALFQKLDTTKVIELGCGHGRHVPKVIDQSEQMTLVDILQKNIDFCKMRFGENGKIRYYKNNGFDLKDLESDSYTALYSYDAMVHFELMDISSYLTEIYRVLSPGGRALLHHSNYHADFKAGFGSAPQGRSFMSRECFAYLAYRAGFAIIEQEVIDWGSDKGLDCVSLIEKPAYTF